MCNHGLGVHGGGETLNGKWHGPFSSADAARSAAGRGGAQIRDAHMPPVKIADDCGRPTGASGAT